MVKRNDLILITVIVILCLAVIVFITGTKSEGSRLKVYVNGKVYSTFPLNEDITFTISGNEGAYNTFENKNGSVHMIAASCPDKLCIKQGSIHYNHETIVCLPNKVTLEIIGNGNDKIDMTAK